MWSGEHRNGTNDAAGYCIVYILYCVSNMDIVLCIYCIVYQIYPYLWSGEHTNGTNDAAGYCIVYILYCVPNIPIFVVRCTQKWDQLRCWILYCVYIVLCIKYTHIWGQVNTQMGPMTLPDIGHNTHVSDFPEIDKIPDHPDREVLFVHPVL